jgi:hypothetical protein
MKRSTSSEGSIDEEMEAIKEPEPVLVRPSTATLPQAKARAKLVPRGANERAPPLVLPPCPDDYESVRDVTQWPIRKDSGSTAAARGPKLHKRQRSMSAAMVSVQAQEDLRLGHQVNDRVLCFCDDTMGHEFDMRRSNVYPGR